jgi:hypothetical protein
MNVLKNISKSWTTARSLYDARWQDLLVHSRTGNSFQELLAAAVVRFLRSPQPIGCRG